jgi:hypothetical protein
MKKIALLLTLLVPYTAQALLGCTNGGNDVDSTSVTFSDGTYQQATWYGASNSSQTNRAVGPYVGKMVTSGFCGVLVNGVFQPWFGSVTNKADWICYSPVPSTVSVKVRIRTVYCG